MEQELLIDLIKIGGPSAVALVVLYLIVKEFLKVINNHIAHNTKVLTEVSERTKEDTKATKENTDVLRDLKTLLYKLNGKK